MLSEIMGRLNAVEGQLAQDQSGMGGLLGGILAVVREGSAYISERARVLRQELDALAAKVARVEEECCKQSKRTPVATILPAEFRRQLGSGNVTAGAGAGTSPTITLKTLPGVGEYNTFGDFSLRLFAGTSPVAGVLAKITPPSAIKGPVKVTLSPADGSTGGSIFDNDPYWIPTYDSNGNLAYLEVGVNAALTASTEYAIRVEVKPQPELAT